MMNERSMDDHEVDLRLGEVFERNAPAFDELDPAPLIHASGLRPVPAARRRRIPRAVAVAASVLVIVAVVGVAVWLAAEHLGGNKQILVITDHTTTTLAKLEPQSETTTTELDPASAASQVDFQVFWLGESYNDLPLRSVKASGPSPGSSGRVDFTYAYHKAGDPPDEHAEMIGLREYASSDPSARKELEEAMAAAGPEEGTPGGDRIGFWSGGEGDLPTLVLVRNGTFVAISAYDCGDAQDLLVRAAKNLIPVTPRTVDHASTGASTSSSVPGATTTSVTTEAQLYPVRVDGKWGFIDNTGTIKIEPQFAGLRRRDGDGMLWGFFEGLAAVQTVQDGPWGYIDTAGRMVIEPQFELAQWFSEGLAVVRNAGQWYFIDKTGATKLGPFDGAINFSAGLASVDKGGTSGLIDKDGAWIPQVEGPNGARLAIERGFFEGLAVARTVSGAGDTSGQLAGYIDRSGNVVIQPRFQGAMDFSEGLAEASVGGNDAAKCGYIDKTGAWVIQPQFEQTSPFSEGVAAVGVRDSKGAFKMGYIDKTGAWVIKPQFEEARSFSEGLALVYWERTCGYIDKTGKLVIPVQYGAAEWDFYGGVVRVGGGFDGAPSYIDTTGKVIWQGE
jgi:hypothetical protein